MKRGRDSILLDLNRQTQEIDAYGTSIASTTTMLCDADGNLLSETTGQSTTVAYAQPSTTSFAYDVLNRPTIARKGDATRFYLT